MIAQASAPAGQPGQGSTTGTLIFMGLMLAGFFFLFIAPQRKKQKEQEAMIASLQSGDEVLTTGGIYGTITNVKEDRFVVRISDNSKIEVAKGFVQSITRKQGAEAKKTA